MGQLSEEIYKLSPPPRLNYTDPIVRHDPQLEKQTVAKPNFSDVGEGVPNHEINIDNKRVEAIEIPVILLNNIVLDYSNITYMNINYDGFVPTIKIIVTQIGHEIEFNDSPGLDNILTVVMTSRVNGAYKPISVNFYINQVKSVGNDLYYFGTYKLLALEQNQTEQITFNPAPDTGCQAQFCKLGPNEHPTTYEFLHVIAEKCGLGFAATDNVKEISDDKYRFITNQTYKDAIQQHIKFAGVDEDSIFDCWIDLYRYLVVVNIPWVLNENVEIQDLGGYIEYESMSGQTQTPDVQDTRMSRRYLTNYREAAGQMNILVKSYKWITNNADLREHGTTNQYFIGGPLGYNDENNGSMNQKDIAVQEETPDGQAGIDEYQFTKNNFIGYEMGNADDGNTPILYQTQIRNSYLRKLRQRRLKVTMNTPNMGLQRGILIYLMIVEYEDKQKRLLAMQSGMENGVIRSIIEQGLPLLNPYLSGFWYIDGMEFSYNKNDKNITQDLYLIKKDPYQNPNSKTNSIYDKFIEQLGE